MLDWSEDANGGGEAEWSFNQLALSFTFSEVIWVSNLDSSLWQEKLKKKNSE